MKKDFFGTCIARKEYQRVLDVLIKYVESDHQLKTLLHTELQVLDSKARVNEKMLIYNEISPREFAEKSKELEIGLTNLISTLPNQLVNDINLDYDAFYDQAIHSAYDQCFSCINPNSSIEFIFQQAGKAYAAIYNETRARDIYIPEPIDHASIYYMSIYLKKVVINPFIQKLNVMELADGITKQMIAFLDNAPDTIDFFKQ